MADPVSAGSAAAARQAVRSAAAIFSAPGDVRRHDRLAHRIYVDLITWARDDVRKQSELIAQKEAELAARGILDSGEREHQEGLIRREFAIRWRDRNRQAERDLEDVRDAETAAHRLYRRLRRRPFPDNPVADELAGLVRPWNDLLRAL